MHLKWTELASDDLDLIEEYITHDNSASVAIDVVLNIIESVHAVLSEFPKAGRHGRVDKTRELIVEGLPFIFVYREHLRTDSLQILRVLHEAQQWPLGKN